MPDDPQYRSLHTHAPDEVTLREADEVDDDEGMMEIRLPIASTGEVRNEGDDPLSGAELRGMAQQVDSLTRGVFPEHGMSNAVDGGQYSQFEKLGYWAGADIERDGASDDEDLLVATARMPDPETLPAATGDYREALAILKEQALRGIPIAASIAWRDDEDAPGGVDLMEASVVGIGADPRTSSEGGEQLVARAAIEAGADPQELVATVRSVAREYGDPDADDARPFGPPNGPADMWDDFDDCVSDVEDWEGIDDPEAFCAWAEEQTSDAEQSMTEDTDPPDDDEGGTDSTEQNADDPIQQALDTLAEREVSTDSLVPLVADATGADESAVEDALDNLQATDEDEDGEDDEMDDEDEDEDEDDEDDGRSADGDGEGDTEDDDARDLDERLDAIEDDLADLRNGETQAADPEAVAEELRSEFDFDADGEGTDADDETDTEDDQRDTTDPAAKPDWAT